MIKNTTEFYKAVIEANVNEDLTAFAQQELDKRAAYNARMKEKRESGEVKLTAKQIESLEFAEKVREYVEENMDSNRVFVAKEIAEAMEVASARVAPALSRLVKAGVLTADNASPKNYQKA